MVERPGRCSHSLTVSARAPRTIKKSNQAGDIWLAIGNMLVFIRSNQVSEISRFEAAISFIAPSPEFMFSRCIR